MTDKRRTGMCLLFVAATALAEPAAPPVATSHPAERGLPTSVPTTSGDAEVDKLLDALEARGASIRGLSAAVEYRDVRFEPVEDVIIKRGEIFLRREQPQSKFLIHFTETDAGGVVNRGGEYYCFDGAWFIERNDKTKTVTKREIPPRLRTDPFRIGAGPFPLPFGQTRADMLANFSISRIPSQKDDPPSTDRLHCIPRPHTELSRKYLRVDLCVDRAERLPVRIEIERSVDENIIDVRFSKMNAGDAPAESRFAVDQGIPKEWTVNVEPLEEGAMPPPR